MLLRAILCIAIFDLCVCEAAPRNYQHPSEAAISNLQNEIANHEAEIRMLTEKINNQEIIIESLGRQVREARQASKEAVRSADENESIRQLKKHAGDSAELLTHYKKKIEQLEGLVKVQNQNIEHLQTAMASLVDALQADVTQEPRVYRVQSGDSLGVIAQKNKTTIKKLKELNGLKTDRIIIGQKLKLPES